MLKHAYIRRKTKLHMKLPKKTKKAERHKTRGRSTEVIFLEHGSHLEMLLIIMLWL